MFLVDLGALLAKWSFWETFQSIHFLCTKMWQGACNEDSQPILRRLIQKGIHLFNVDTSPCVRPSAHLDPSALACACVSARRQYSSADINYASPNTARHTVVVGQVNIFPRQNLRFLLSLVRLELAKDWKILALSAGKICTRSLRMLGRNSSRVTTVDLNC